MINTVFLICHLQLILVVNYLMAIQYQFLLEDEGIFSECKDQEPGTLNIDGLFDRSNMKFFMDDEGISISGNHTLIWDVQPSDRIEVAGSLLYFDRGTWQPTTLNMVSKDFCKVMYDPRQIWYDFYSKHVTNRPDIEETCVRVMGTIFVMDLYTLDPHIGLGVPLKPGRYAVHLEFLAFDKSNVRRPNPVCFEIKGEFFKA